jgi:FLVCR family feline leukemia virus subgroup C receptor-related protein
MTGYLPIGFEFGAEITYPQSEATSSALLNLSIAISALTMTAGCQAVLEGSSEDPQTEGGYDAVQGSLYANIVMIIALFIGTILTWLTKENLLRQNAQRESENFDGIENKTFDESEKSTDF